MSFDAARAVADTLLYEGYVLYPYRASAKKNQVRFQFGVVAPRAYAESVGTDDDETSKVSGAAEPWRTRTECLVEPGDDTDVTVLLRFLQLQARMVEERTDDGFRPVAELDASGSHLVSWDEAVEQSVEMVVSVRALLAGHRTQSFSFPATEEIEDLPGGEGRVVRRRWPLSGRVVLTAEEFPGPYGVVRLRIEVENLSEWGDDDPGGARDEALRRSLLSAHSLLGVSSGHFISLLDPPEWATPAGRRLPEPAHLAGDDGRRRRDAVVPDHPLRPAGDRRGESRRPLRRARDRRDPLAADDDPHRRGEARGPGDRPPGSGDHRPGRHHVGGDPVAPARRPAQRRAGRQGHASRARPTCFTGGRAAAAPGKDADVPWWDPGADSSVDPDKDSILVGGVLVSKGSRVKLRPGRHLDDANGARHLTDGQDLFYDGRTAIVQGVFFDVDGAEYLAVSLEDVPDADLAHGRFLYFNPAEVEPLEAAR